MKKLICILFVIVLSFMLSCYPALENLKSKMIDKYTNDKNYVTLSGEIIESNDDYVEIKCEELTNYINCTKENCHYYIYSEQTIELSVGDQIEFITVPFHFYDGQKLPIVELKKGGKTLLSFEEGKKNLINWVNQLQGK